MTNKITDGKSRKGPSPYVHNGPYSIGQVERPDPCRNATVRRGRDHQSRPVSTPTVAVAFRVRYRLASDPKGTWRVTDPMFEVDATTFAKNISFGGAVTLHPDFPNGVEPIPGWEFGPKVDPGTPDPDDEPTVLDHFESLAGPELRSILFGYALALDSKDHPRAGQFMLQLLDGMADLPCTTHDDAAKVVSEYVGGKVVLPHMKCTSPMLHDR